MSRLLSVSCAAALLLAAFAAAQEGGDKEAAPKRPVGSWAREIDGGLKVTFDIKPGGLVCTMRDGDRRISSFADYGVTKDGVLYGRLNKVEAEGVDDAPTAGVMFSFRYAVKDGVLTVSDLLVPGTDINAKVRDLIEGDYKAAKK